LSLQRHYRMNMNSGKVLSGWAISCTFVVAALLLAGCGGQQKYTEAQFSDMPGITVTPSGTTTNLGIKALAEFNATNAAPTPTAATLPLVPASSPGTATAPVVPVSSPGTTTAPVPQPTSTGAAGGAAHGTPMFAGRTDELNVGDMLTIKFSDLINPLQPIEQRIKDNGTITLMENQTFTAAGKLRGDLEQEIRSRYVPRFYVKMTVTIDQPERYYFVSGEVRSPSKLIYTPPMTVLKAIAASGGFTDFASKKKVTLTRSDGRIETINCVKALTNPTLDLQVFPGDTVHVPRSIL
jgi:protein involved in polysaccharide export with SLBB domain